MCKLSVGNARGNVASGARGMGEVEPAPLLRLTANEETSMVILLAVLPAGVVTEGNGWVCVRYNNGCRHEIIITISYNKA